MTPQARLLAWYTKNKRDLPWRQTRDPYRILVSEIMLQQTQVDRVLAYYSRWLEAFPSEHELASADLDTVHRLWKGLGYPNRAERLQRCCQLVLADYNGMWPDTPEGLQALPGIGPYTAGAVACFAFAQATPLVDTNVARVYARRDQLPLPLNKKELWQHAATQVHPKRPVEYNNALMELGALVCTARNPDCDRCPWQSICRMRDVEDSDERWQQTGNPLKVATAKKRYGVRVTDRKKLRQHIVLGLIHDEGKYLVAQRPLEKHQGGFWELPGGKRERGETDREALARELDEELGAELLSARPFVEWTYEYDDRYLTFHCYRCRLFNPEAVQALASDRLSWVEPREFVALEFPPANAPVIDRFISYHRLGEKNR